MYLPGFLTAEGLARMREDSERFTPHARRRDVDESGEWKTPRHLFAIGAQTIRKIGTVIPQFFENEGLWQFVSGVVGKDAVPYGDPDENCVVTVLAKLGDQHGAHCDDFPWVCNIAIDTPPPGSGGVLRFAPYCTDVQSLESSHSRLLPLKPGDAYVLQTDKTVHEVTKLTLEGCRRVLVSFAFIAKGEVKVSSATSKALFSDDGNHDALQ